MDSSTRLKDSGSRLLICFRRSPGLPPPNGAVSISAQISCSNRARWWPLRWALTQRSNRVGGIDTRGRKPRLGSARPQARTPSAGAPCRSGSVLLFRANPMRRANSSCRTHSGAAGTCGGTVAGSRVAAGGTQEQKLTFGVRKALSATLPAASEGVDVITPATTLPGLGGSAQPGLVCLRHFRRVRAAVLER